MDFRYFYSLMSPEVRTGGQLLFIRQAEIGKYTQILHTND